MRPAAPAWLRAQIRSHNLHALALAVLAAAVAVLAWAFAWLFSGVILLNATMIVRGEATESMPAWLPCAALLPVAALFVWGGIDQFLRRFETPTDRPIVGWHLIREILLLPPRLTFSIWGNFLAVRWLNKRELARAWELVATIQRARKARLGALTFIEPDPSRLFRLLSALQLIHVIDLHRGEEGWFYVVRSTCLDEVRDLLRGAEQEY